MMKVGITMKQTSKKGLIGLFAVLMVVPILSVHVSAHEAEADNRGGAGSSQLVEKADKYISLENKKYVYAENTALTAPEAEQVKAMVAEANKTLTVAEG